MATTFDARAVAREASKAVGRTVTDKQVRDMARDNLARFDKTAHPAYLSHDYTAAERTRLLALFRERAGRGKARGGTTRKARSAARAVKSAPEATE